MLGTTGWTCIALELRAVCKLACRTMAVTKVMAVWTKITKFIGSLTRKVVWHLSFWGCFISHVAWWSLKPWSHEFIEWETSKAMAKRGAESWDFRKFVVSGVRGIEFCMLWDLVGKIHIQLGFCWNDFTGTPKRHIDHGSNLQSSRAVLFEGQLTVVRQAGSEVRCLGQCQKVFKSDMYHLI